MPISEQVISVIVISFIECIPTLRLSVLEKTIQIFYTEISFKNYSVG